ncbi:MAG TPA: hypothetical protein VJQ48_13520, partial [Candidatus Binatia bacterium]|nr:hypothetical protein [Candidatus Binatia bacterium]
PREDSSLQIAGPYKLSRILNCKEREVRSTGRTNRLQQSHREQSENSDFFKACSKSRQTLWCLMNLEWSRLY